MHLTQFSNTNAVVQTLSLPELPDDSFTEAPSQHAKPIVTLNPLHQIKAQIQVCAGSVVMSCPNK